MSTILILGGGGMVGQKLAHRLAALGTAETDIDLFDIDRKSVV